MLPLVFWVSVYCIAQTTCYVGKEDNSVNVRKYDTAAACIGDKSGARAHKNSGCAAVNSVSCFNGGSRCTFDPADDSAAAVKLRLVPMPKE
jgi:hypothetical protein